MSTPEALFEEAVTRAYALEEDFFRLAGPSYFTERGGGFAIWSGRQRVGFDARGEACLEEVVRRLAAQPRVKASAGEDFVRKLVFQGAARAAGRLLASEPLALQDEFDAVRAQIAAERPSVVVFPVRDLAGGRRPRRIGPFVVGRVGETLERYLDQAMRDAGSPTGFQFDDSVSWTEDYLGEKEDPEYRGRAVGQLVVGLISPFRGSLAHADAFTRLEVLFGALCFLAERAGIQHFRTPSIGAERDDESIQWGEFEETADVLTVDADGRSNRLEIAHGWEVLDAYALARGWGRMLLQRVLQRGPAGAHAIDDRLARFCHSVWHARRVHDFLQRLLFSITAVEALLGSGDKNTPIVSTVAERVALLLPAADGAARMRTAREVRRLYDARSSLVHSGMSVAVHDAEEVFRASRDAEKLANRVGEEFARVSARARWANADHLREWFDKRKYGAR